MDRVADMIFVFNVFAIFCLLPGSALLPVSACVTLMIEFRTLPCNPAGLVFLLLFTSHRFGLLRFCLP